MKHFNKLFNGLAVILMVYSFIIGGFDLGQHHYQLATPNLIVGAFWLIIMIVLTSERVHNARTKATLQTLEDVQAILDKAAQEEEIANQKRRDERMAMAEAAKAAPYVQKSIRRVEVKDGDKPAPKPPTKAQQRKPSARKTSKPVATTTTTQRGQTKLV